MADDAPAPKKENVFTRKIGPMPMWAWVAIVGAVVIGYAYYKNKQNAAATSSTTTAGNVTPPTIEQFQLNTPPTQVNVTDEDTDSDDKKKKPKTPPHHHNRHKPRPHPDNEKKETDFVQDRELAAHTEFGSPAYRKKYGRTWREQRAAHR